MIRSRIIVKSIWIIVLIKILFHFNSKINVYIWKKSEKTFSTVIDQLTSYIIICLLCTTVNVNITSHKVSDKIEVKKRELKCKVIFQDLWFREVLNNSKWIIMLCKISHIHLYKFDQYIKLNKNMIKSSSYFTKSESFSFLYFD